MGHTRCLVRAGRPAQVRLVIAIALAASACAQSRELDGGVGPADASADAEPPDASSPDAFCPLRGMIRRWNDQGYCVEVTGCCTDADGKFVGPEEALKYFYFVDKENLISLTYEEARGFLDPVRFVVTDR